MSRTRGCGYTWVILATLRGCDALILGDTRRVIVTGRPRFGSVWLRRCGSRVERYRLFRFGSGAVPRKGLNRGRFQCRFLENGSSGSGSAFGSRSGKPIQTVLVASSGSVVAPRHHEYQYDWHIGGGLLGVGGNRGISFKSAVSVVNSKTAFANCASLGIRNLAVISETPRCSGVSVDVSTSYSSSCKLPLKPLNCPAEGQYTKIPEFLSLPL